MRLSNLDLTGTSAPGAAEGLPGAARELLSGDHEDADFPKAAGFTGNVALIMEEEPTAIHNFAPVVTHFRNTLDPSWQMVILTRRGWSIPQSLMLRNQLASGSIKVRFLPPEFDHFPSHSSVSIFLTSPWLWEQFENVNRLFMFQPDSILCANANATVDDFLEWDYIGAPMASEWIDSRKGDETHEAHPDAQGFNGGLCMRNPRLFLELARRYDFKADLYSGPAEFTLRNYMRFEDHWFMRKLEETPELMAKTKLPPPHVAGQFSVETWFWERPLGYHQPHRWQPERYDEIAEWCPEVGMIYSMEMPDGRWGKREIGR
ncbi:unnamed protein product [Discula destructiva]